MPDEFTAEEEIYQLPEDGQEDYLDHEHIAPLPPLTREQQQRVSQHLELVRIHLVVRVPAPDFPTRQREYQDLYQEGCLALARAAAKYDPQRDGLFAPYALYRIRFAIHRAIDTRFSLVYIPVRARTQHSRDPNRHRYPIYMSPINSQLEEKMTIEHRTSQPHETIRHVIRTRFELAVSRTLEHMRQQQWRRRNPAEIMQCIAEKRLLIASRRRQTPLRQISREFKMSISRIESYERILEKEVKREFRSDPQVRVLLEMAKEAHNGRDSFMDDEQWARLREAEVAAFEERFGQMPPQSQAQTIYSLIERCTHDVREIAKNLFSLTLPNGSELVRTVA